MNLYLMGTSSPMTKAKDPCAAMAGDGICMLEHKQGLVVTLDSPEPTRTYPPTRVGTFCALAQTMHPIRPSKEPPTKKYRRPKLSVMRPTNVPVHLVNTMPCDGKWQSGEYSLPMPCIKTYTIAAQTMLPGAPFRSLLMRPRLGATKVNEPMPALNPRPHA